ncbi:deltex-related RING finger [Cryptosporidium bovis]|uniref:deltex-related RING finger n=1 Tax=Cryptosporidium bovis TaxID=310047 RepID=UPI003519E6E4|nr:deltex-related RING finger [Cryptosporidium bovis]
MWRWWSDEGWVYYSLENSAIIEKSWRSKEVNIIVNVGGIPFLLNLRHFYQFNFITQRHRRISRDISSAVWFWTDNNGQLNLYQPNISAQIERFYLHMQWDLHKEVISEVSNDNKENTESNNNDFKTVSILKKQVAKPKTGRYVVWNQYDIYPIECKQVNRITGKERKIYRRYLKRVDLLDNSNYDEIQYGVEKERMDFKLEWEFTDTSIAQFDDALSLIIETGEYVCEGHQKVFTEDEINKVKTELINEKIDDDCCLCLHRLEDNLIRLNKCSHVYHNECLSEMIGHLKGKNSLFCPLCMTVQCFGKGSSPPGIMRYIVYKSGNIEIESYPNINVIEIEYFIPNGIQNNRHPNPNKPYIGTYKIAYLPYDEQGKILLKGLSKAFKLGHTFKVSSLTNSTTGINMDITQWNIIPHKISTCGGPALQGFPDPFYYGNVLKKLSSLGIECEFEDGEETKQAS